MAGRCIYTQAGPGRGVEHLLLIFSSRTPGVEDEGVPGPRHWRHVSAGSSGRKLSRLQTWRERESGPLWRKVRYWGFDENVLIFKIIGLHHPNLFINALHILVHDVYSLNTCLHKIISSANNAEAQEERQGIVCLVVYIIFPLALSLMRLRMRMKLGIRINIRLRRWNLFSLTRVQPITKPN